MIKKKSKKKNNLLNILFKSKNLYGESLKNTNKEVLPYIYAIRHKYSIINLKEVSFVLKRIFKLIEFTIRKKKKILIIGNSDEINFLINKQFIKNNNNIIFYNKEWVNGLITNKTIKFYLKKKNIRLILIIKSAIDEKYLNQELSTLQIPILSLINTDQSLKHINYPVVSNSKNIKSIFTLMFLLRKFF
jgi:ribosomal protein S2